VKLWDVASGKEIACLDAGHGKYGQTIAFTPDGKRLASLHDRSFRSWDVTQTPPKLQLVMLAPDAEAETMVFGPDGDTLATGDWDGKLRVRDAHSGQIRATVPGHEGRVTALAAAATARSCCPAAGTARFASGAGAGIDPRNGCPCRPVN